MPSSLSARLGALVRPRDTIRWQFRGAIAGLGTAEGTRLVIGHWPRSPFGPFSDVMVERPDGHRMLLAPSPDVAEFVSSTYRFDEIVILPVTVSICGHPPSGQRWQVEAGPLRVRFLTGSRTAAGWALAAIPPAVAERPAFAAAVDPVARLVMRGVRTVGSAGNDRREWYAATDVHRIVLAEGTWADTPLGQLRDVHPPVRFGFGSTPRRPVVTRLVTTVEWPAPPPA